MKKNESSMSVIVDELAASVIVAFDGFEVNKDEVNKLCEKIINSALAGENDVVGIKIFEKLSGNIVTFPFHFGEETEVDVRDEMLEVLEYLFHGTHANCRWPAGKTLDDMAEYIQLVK